VLFLVSLSILVVKKMKTFLALGDSYTIGESVLLTETFAYQTVQVLRNKNINISAPEIIAKTGWTTDELLEAISQYTFSSTYHLVTLLIGVNNQYRGRSVNEFEIEFIQLLQKAIAFADGKTKNVFVLSIPDWGVTPFAVDRNIKQIAVEIDAYNLVCQKIALQHNCNFIDITTSQRADANNDEMLASDGLHPSGKEYKKWAEKVMDNFIMDN
jgi:lysophospholipase L1-like esterase